MTITDRLKNIFTNQQPQKAAPPQPLQQGNISIANNNVAPPLTTFDHIESYKKISWIYKAVKKNADKVSEIELKLMRQTSQGEAEIVDNHPVLELLASVNDFMTFEELVKITQGYLELVGEAYWAKIRDAGGNVVELWPLRPDKVEIIRSDEDFISGFIYKPRYDSKVIFETDDIIQFKEFDPTSPFRGVGAVMAVAYTGDSDLLAQKWNRNFFFNAAMPMMAILFKDTVHSDTIKRFSRSWEAKHRGADNAHKTAMLKGVEQILSDIQPSHKDMDFLEMRKFNRDEILAIFGVPKTVVGLSDDVNRANAEATTNSWLEHEIRPKMRYLVGAMTEFLLRDYNAPGLYFDFVDPVPDNLDYQLELYRSQGIPWMTINEIRAGQSLDPIPEGDKLYIPFNLTPIDVSKPDVDQKTFKSGLGKIPLKKSIVSKKEKHLKELKKYQKDFIKVFSQQMSKAQKTYSEEQKELVWKQLVSITDEMEKQLKKAVDSLHETQKNEVLTKLRENKSIKQINDPFEVEEWVINFKNELTPIIIQIIKQQGQEAADQLQSSFNDTTSNILEYLKDEGLKFAKLANETTYKKIRSILLESEKEGLGIDEISQKIAQEYQDISNVRAQNIARSETLRASNFARLEAYKQVEGIKEYEWLTALDERTCPWCNAMDGKTIKIGESFFDQGEELTVKNENDKDVTISFKEYGVKFPPLHPQCRCTTVPKF